MKTITLITMVSGLALGAVLARDVSAGQRALLEAEATEVSPVGLYLNLPPSHLRTLDLSLGDRTETILAAGLRGSTSALSKPAATKLALSWPSQLPRLRRAVVTTVQILKSQKLPRFRELTRD